MALRVMTYESKQLLNGTLKRFSHSRVESATAKNLFDMFLSAKYQRLFSVIERATHVQSPDGDPVAQTQRKRGFPMRVDLSTLGRSLDQISTYGG